MLYNGSNLYMQIININNPSWCIHWAISCSSQCSTTSETSCGALVKARNSSMRNSSTSSMWGIDPATHRAIRGHSVMELHLTNDQIVVSIALACILYHFPFASRSMYYWLVICQITACNLFSIFALQFATQISDCYTILN